MHHPPTQTTPPITACLLHADYHPMTTDCWEHTLDWYFEHQDQSPAFQRDSYQAAVERRILNDLCTERLIP